MRMLDINRSKLRANLLTYYFSNPETRLHLRELADRLNENPGNLSRELKRLTEEGLFRAEKIGRQKFFSLNQEYGLYREIKSIVGKTIGLPIILERIFEGEKEVLSAFIYGSFASGEASPDSDIDVILLLESSRWDETSTEKKISSLERKIDREINWSYFPVKEWVARFRQGDSFVKNVLAAPIIAVKGDEKEIRRFTADRSA